MMKQKIKTIFLFIAYLMIRTIKLLSSWKGIPNFDNWLKHETKEKFTFDLMKVIFVFIEVTLFVFISWFWFIMVNVISAIYVEV